VTFEVRGNAKEESLNVFIQVNAVFGNDLPPVVLLGCCRRRCLVLLNMSLDTESSVGEERAKQG